MNVYKMDSSRLTIWQVVSEEVNIERHNEDTTTSNIKLTGEEAFRLMEMLRVYVYNTGVNNFAKEEN